MTHNFHFPRPGSFDRLKTSLLSQLQYEIRYSLDLKKCVTA